MTTFNDITFIKTSIYNGQINLNNPNLGNFILSVSYGDKVNGIGPNKNQYEVALYNNLNKFIQLHDYDNTIGFVSNEDINEFIKLVQTATNLKEITEHFRDNFSDEED